MSGPYSTEWDPIQPLISDGRAARRQVGLPLLSSVSLKDSSAQFHIVECWFPESSPVMPWFRLKKRVGSIKPSELVCTFFFFGKRCE